MSSSTRCIVKVTTVELARAICIKYFALNEDRIFCVCHSKFAAAAGLQVLTSDEVAMLRLEFEMRAFGALCGHHVTGGEVFQYLSVQLPRYFGLPVSFKLKTRFLRAIANAVIESSFRGYIFADDSGCYPHCIHRWFENGSMVAEEISKIMYTHWFDLFDVCSIPFNHPDLKGRLPNLVLPIPSWQKLSKFLRAHIFCYVLLFFLVRWFTLSS